MLAATMAQSLTAANTHGPMSMQQPQAWQRTLRCSPGGNLRSTQQSIQGRLSAECSTPAKPKLLDRLAQAFWPRRCSRRTEQTYCHWVTPFVFFHHVRHPAELGERGINVLMTHLAVKEKVGTSTQMQALSVLGETSTPQAYADQSDHYLPEDQALRQPMLAARGDMGRFSHRIDLRSTM
jgi:hypothetical protein